MFLNNRFLRALTEMDLLDKPKIELVGEYLELRRLARERVILSLWHGMVYLITVQLLLWKPEDKFLTDAASVNLYNRRSINGIVSFHMSAITVPWPKLLKHAVKGTDHLPESRKYCNLRG